MEEPQPIRPHPWSPQAGLAERWSGTGAHRKQARGQGGGSLQGKVGSLEPSRSSALDREAQLSLGPPRRGQSKEGGEGLRALEGSLSPLSAGNFHLWEPGRKANGHHGGLKPSAPWHAGQGTLPLGFSFTICEQEYQDRSSPDLLGNRWTLPQPKRHLGLCLNGSQVYRDGH